MIPVVDINEANAYVEHTDDFLIEPAHLESLYPGIPAASALRMLQSARIRPFGHDRLGSPLFRFGDVRSVLSSEGSIPEKECPIE